MCVLQSDGNAAKIYVYFYSTLLNKKTFFYILLVAPDLYTVHLEYWGSKNSRATQFNVLASSSTDRSYFGGKALTHRLNMELDLQSLFGLHVHSCTHLLRPRKTLPPSPPAFGLIYEGAIGQPR